MRSAAFVFSCEVYDNAMLEDHQHFYNFGVLFPKLSHGERSINHAAGKAVAYTSTNWNVGLWDRHFACNAFYQFALKLSMFGTR